METDRIANIKAFRDATTPQTRESLIKHLRMMQEDRLELMDTCLLNNTPLNKIATEYCLLREVIEVVEKGGENV